MTNHEQRIILAWLEAEKARIETEHDAADAIMAEIMRDEWIHIRQLIFCLAALDTSAPALTEDERKAQAAGIMGKMVLP